MMAKDLLAILDVQQLHQEIVKEYHFIFIVVSPWLKNEKFLFH